MRRTRLSAMEATSLVCTMGEPTGRDVSVAKTRTAARGPPVSDHAPLTISRRPRECGWRAPRTLVVVAVEDGDGVAAD